MSKIHFKYVSTDSVHRQYWRVTAVYFTDRNWISNTAHSYLFLSLLLYWKCYVIALPMSNGIFCVWSRHKSAIDSSFLSKCLNFELKRFLCNSLIQAHLEMCLHIFFFISLTLFSVGLINSCSKITNKYQLKQKI